MGGDKVSRRVNEDTDSTKRQTTTSEQEPFEFHRLLSTSGLIGLSIRQYLHLESVILTEWLSFLVPILQAITISSFVTSIAYGMAIWRGKEESSGTEEEPRPWSLFLIAPFKHWLWKCVSHNWKSWPTDFLPEDWLCSIYVDIIFGLVASSKTSLPPHINRDFCSNRQTTRLQGHLILCLGIISGPSSYLLSTENKLERVTNIIAVSLYPWAEDKYQKIVGWNRNCREWHSTSSCRLYIVCVAGSEIGIEFQTKFIFIFRSSSTTPSVFLRTLLCLLESCVILPTSKYLMVIKRCFSHQQYACHSRESNN